MHSNVVWASGEWEAWAELRGLPLPTASVRQLHWAVCSSPGSTSRRAQESEYKIQLSPEGGVRKAVTRARVLGPGGCTRPTQSSLLTLAAKREAEGRW